MYDSSDEKVAFLNGEKDACLPSENAAIDELAPPCPATLDEIGVDREELEHLVLKLAYSVPRFNTQWAAEKTCLPLQIVAELLDGMRRDKLMEVLGHAGHFNYEVAITDRGREHARRLLEICGYVGPAPVSLEAYVSLLEKQCARFSQPTSEQISEAVSDLVLTDTAIQVAGMAMMSRRSLFLYGDPGNGKTHLGYLLHDAVEGDMWVPYCIGIGNNVIRVFDQEAHEPIIGDDGGTRSNRIDRRWVRIKRPFVVVGGELTIEALDLAYSASLGFYEAPLHFKANGGTFLLDDLGCQRVDTTQLLNRWIHPLEKGVDFLTLRSGQQIEVPFRQMLIVSTNLDVNKVMTPAFLRRIGYRVNMLNPTAKDYADIFRRYSRKCDAEAPPELVEKLIRRYELEGRTMHGCEPRDLIERSRDICRYRQQPFQINEEILDLAWQGYFGDSRKEMTN